MNGDTHSSKTVVNGGDDQRVAHPDESRRSQGYPTQRASNGGMREVTESQRPAHQRQQPPPTPCIESKDAPRFWDTLSLSAGRERSFRPAATRHHFMIGAQKKTVFGPA